MGREEREPVRSVGGTDDGAVEVDVECDFVALDVCEGVGCVEGVLDCVSYTRPGVFFWGG